MTREQKLTIATTFIVGTLCLVLPYIFHLLESREELIRFEGVIYQTELKLSDKSPGFPPRWSKILIKEQTDHFWIYLDTGGVKEAFMVSSYPALTKKLLTLQAGESITIQATRDILGRGHYFPKVIQRGEEQVLSQEDMKKYWDRNHNRILNIVGFVLYFIVIFEVWYYRSRKKKEYVALGFEEDNRK